ncbi:hypothetical protein SNL152K_5174 [Streptomyces sp. NL15-2K]|nr:hypothetical protein SNL152K_5174 [Streptomyces sp. NL15-2K]
MYRSVNSGPVSSSRAIASASSYSHDVSRNKYGHLQYGARGYKVSWTKYRSSGSSCDGVKVRSGKAILPTKEVGSKYWETAS